MCDWLTSFIAFSFFQLLYMTLAIDKMDGHGLQVVNAYQEDYKVLRY